jgi:hypothetical protein
LLYIVVIERASSKYSSSKVSSIKSKVELRNRIIDQKARLYTLPHPLPHFKQVSVDMELIIPK